MYEYIILHNVDHIYTIFMSTIFSNCGVGFQGCIFLATNQHGGTIYLRGYPEKTNITYSCTYLIVPQVACNILAHTSHIN